MTGPNGPDDLEMVRWCLRAGAPNATPAKIQEKEKAPRVNTPKLDEYETKSSVEVRVR